VEKAVSSQHQTINYLCYKETEGQIMIISGTK